MQFAAPESIGLHGPQRCSFCTTREADVSRQPHLAARPGLSGLSTIIYPSDSKYRLYVVACQRRLPWHSVMNFGGSRQTGQIVAFGTRSSITATGGHRLSRVDERRTGKHQAGSPTGSRCELMERLVVFAFVLPLVAALLTWSSATRLRRQQRAHQHHWQRRHLRPHRRRAVSRARRETRHPGPAGHHLGHPAV